MKGYLTFAALTVSLAAMAAAPIPPVFIPFAITYVDGELMAVIPLSDPDNHDMPFRFPTLRECMQKVEAAVEHSMQAGHMSAGSGLVGTCVPAASVDPTRRGTAT